MAAAKRDGEAPDWQPLPSLASNKVALGGNMTLSQPGSDEHRYMRPNIDQTTAAAAGRRRIAGSSLQPRVEAPPRDANTRLKTARGQSQDVASGVALALSLCERLKFPDEAAVDHSTGSTNRQPNSTDSTAPPRPAGVSGYAVQQSRCRRRPGRNSDVPIWPHQSPSGTCGRHSARGAGVITALAGGLWQSAMSCRLSCRPGGRAILCVRAAVPPRRDTTRRTASQAHRSVDVGSMHEKQKAEAGVAQGTGPNPAIWNAAA